MKKLFIFIIFLITLSSCNIKLTSTSVKAKVYYNYKTIEPYLTLTFDDGPDKIQTIKVLKILEKYNIKATFFVLGEEVEYQTDILKKIFEAGHEIGNHFYKHDNINKMSKVEIRESIVKNNELIYSIIGIKPKVVRPPYGIVNDKLKEVCGDLNMDIIIWSNNKDSLDWKLTPYKDIVKNVTKKNNNGDIFLFHDGSKKYTNTLAAIDIIIPQLIDEGYTWTTISDLLKK